MSKKILSIHAASGTDSTQAQDQAVKSFSSSSSNLNNASEQEQSSSLELPRVSIKGVANNVEVDVDNNEVEEFDLKDFALTHFRWLARRLCGHLWQVCQWHTARRLA